MNEHDVPTNTGEDMEATDTNLSYEESGIHPSVDMLAVNFCGLGLFGMVIVFVGSGIAHLFGA